MALRIRRGTDAERTSGSGVIFAEGELVYVTDTDALYIGDNVTPGGILIAGSSLGILNSFIAADTITNKVKLLQDLTLNGNNIVGTGDINIAGTITATGNINIGDNATEDTVTLTAKVDSDIVPTQDSVYNLGKVDKRWQNVYATGLTVYGQIDAAAVNANIIADNSDVMVDVVTNTLSGNLTGNMVGTVIGSLVGDVAGNVSGNLTGNVVGSVFSDNSTTLVDGVAGVLRGDHYGNLYGSVKAANGSTILNPGTNGLDASIVAAIIGNVTGNITGNVLGNVAGDITGNVIGNTTGFHTGDTKGSVFADSSTILVDAVAGRIPGAVVSGTVTADLIGNVTGNVTGILTGNIFTNSIDSADSSEIVFTPNVRTQSDLTVENSIIVGSGNVVITADSIITSAAGQPVLTITGNQIVAAQGEGGITIDVAQSTVNILGNTRSGSLDILGNDPRADGNYGIRITSPREDQSAVEILGAYSGPTSAATVVIARAGVENVEDEFAALVNADQISSIDFYGNSAIGLPVFGLPGNTLALAAKIVTSVDGTVSAGIVPGKIDITITGPSGITETKISVGHSKVSVAVPFKFVVVADDAARTALVPTPEKGMLILMEAGAAPAATNQLQFYNGTAWINV